MRFHTYHTPQRFKYQYNNVITQVDIHVVVKNQHLTFHRKYENIPFMFCFFEHIIRTSSLKSLLLCFVDIKLMRSNLVFHKCWVRGRKRRLKRCNKTDNRRRNINYALLSQKKGQLSEWKIFIVGVIKRGFFVLDFFISHLSVITFAFYILYCCSLLLSTEFMGFYSLYILRQSRNMSQLSKKISFA